MEAIKRQASKFREQVAKQQQAILKQLGKETDIFDDDELQGYQKLQNLYNSTRETKHFQREIVRGVESSVSTMKKQLEIVRKLAENCCKFANEYQEAGSSVSRAVMQFGTAHSSIEDEKEAMLGIFVDQVSNPLRASITGAPLEDARHLTRRCERLRQEVESQAAEVIKRQSRSKDASVESVMKLKNAEARLTEHRASMVVLQREATTAMLSVEDQQQQLTFQKLVTMVGAERSYHVYALNSLDELHSKMILEMQLIESSWKPETSHRNVNAPPAHKDATISGSDDQATDSEGHDYFMAKGNTPLTRSKDPAKVKHPFDAQADGELNLAIDEYVAVYKVAPSGWSEGKCMGRTGWFPSAYVERVDNALDT
nr:PREDICTED: SH3 domain-containing protein 1 isoform X2 [Daucus carota subsp. sativus]